MEINIKVFLDAEGRIRQIPAPHKKKLAVLSYLAEKIEPGRQYGEKEVNQIIQHWHTFNDYFLLRRLLIDHKFLGRLADGSAYWVLQRDDIAGGL